MFPPAEVLLKILVPSVLAKLGQLQRKGVKEEAACTLPADLGMQESQGDWEKAQPEGIPHRKA